MSVLIKESVSGLRHGHKAVGTSAVQLGGPLPYLPNKGILVRCPGADDPVPNTVPIWVGSTAAVTADSVETSGGFPVLPGDALFIPADDIEKIWCISTAASQDIAWLAI